MKTSTKKQKKKLVYSVWLKREMNAKTIDECERVCVCHASVFVCRICHTRSFWNSICVGNDVRDGRCDRMDRASVEWMNHRNTLSLCVIVKNWSCATSSTGTGEYWLSIYWARDDWSAGRKWETPKCMAAKRRVQDSPYNFHLIRIVDNKWMSLNYLVSDAQQ